MAKLISKLLTFYPFNHNDINGIVVENITKLLLLFALTNLECQYQNKSLINNHVITINNLTNTLVIFIPETISRDLDLLNNYLSILKNSEFLNTIITNEQKRFILEKSHISINNYLLNLYKFLYNITIQKILNYSKTRGFYL